MTASYDAQIDGYWAPVGLGGSTPSTDVISYEIQGNDATLYCETRSIPEEESAPILTTVQMEYSEDYGWRFSSCKVMEE